MVYDDKTFVYSADTNVCENLDHALEGADLAVLDCAFSSATYKPNGPHLCSVLCSEYAKKYNVKTLLSHLPPEGDVGTIIREANKITDICRLIEKKEYFI
jgi:ribonuclease BN (tRNA processing enzyme)